MPKNPADINPPISKNPDITFIGIDPGPVLTCHVVDVGGVID